jgi:hypothetical protein
MLDELICNTKKMDSNYNLCVKNEDDRSAECQLGMI